MLGAEPAALDGAPLPGLPEAPDAPPAGVGFPAVEPAPVLLAGSLASGDLFPAACPGPLPPAGEAGGEPALPEPGVLSGLPVGDGLDEPEPLRSDDDEDEDGAFEEFEEFEPGVPPPELPWPVDDDGEPDGGGDDELPLDEEPPQPASPRTRLATASQEAERQRKCSRIDGSARSESCKI